MKCNIIPKLFGITTLKPNFIYLFENTCFCNSCYRNNTIFVRIVQNTSYMKGTGNSEYSLLKAVFEGFLRLFNQSIDMIMKDTKFLNPMGYFIW